MNKELTITIEDIELLKEMKNNCLKADVYNDEKRLLKANAITKFLMLQQQNKELKNKIDKAIKELDRIITFCENDSQGSYDICNIAIRNYKNIKGLLKDSDVDE